MVFLYNLENYRDFNEPNQKCFFLKSLNWRENSEYTSRSSTKEIKNLRLQTLMAALTEEFHSHSLEDALLPFLHALQQHPQYTKKLEHSYECISREYLSHVVLSFERIHGVADSELWTSAPTAKREMPKIISRIFEIQAVKIRNICLRNKIRSKWKKYPGLLLVHRTLASELHIELNREK